MTLGQVVFARTETNPHAEIFGPQRSFEFGRVSYDLHHGNDAHRIGKEVEIRNPPMVCLWSSLIFFSLDKIRILAYIKVQNQSKLHGGIYETD
jgi:hypothetical protein